VASRATQSRIIEGTVFAGLAILLVVTFLEMGGRTPTLREAPATLDGAVPAPPLGAARVLFDLESYGKLIVSTNNSNPFNTDYFVPAPPPIAIARKLSLSYRGYFETGAGVRKAYLSVDGVTVGVKVGDTVSASVRVDRIEKGSIILSDGAGRTHVLGFRKESAIEIPNQ
jgi:hypothetical protein